MSQFVERERAELVGDLDILVVGDGFVGEKAQQLIDKTEVLRSLGFRTPRRTVLAEGFLGNIKERVEKRALVPKQIEMLQRICRSYGDTPLVIRSSAAGDARGTGTYKSVFCENRIEEVERGLLEVLASYFSPSAVVFRRDAGTGEGLGIIVEPIIGQDFNGSFAPALSGFGYTSTSRGEGYVVIVPGLGCGVESNNGERITKNKAKEHGGLLGEYVFCERDAVLCQLKAMKRSALLRTGWDFNDGSYGARVFSFSSRLCQTGVVNTSIEYPDDIQQALDGIDLLRLFSTMEELESALNHPQYFEWVVTVESDQPVFWVVQIADVDKKLDLMDFENFGRAMFMGHTVTGTGIKKATKIVCCWDSIGVPLLHKFNQENSNYVLLFSGELTRRSRHKFNYDDFSNASVFLEIPSAFRADNPVSHLGGQLDMTGKLFAVLDYDAEVFPDWDLFCEGKQRLGGLTVFDGDIKVIASERQNKLMVCVG